jgi:hypothetical protein
MEFFTDFCREFEEVSICTLGPDFNHDGSVDQAEAVKVTFGEWLPGEFLGRRFNFVTKFRENTEFFLFFYCFLKTIKKVTVFYFSSLYFTFSKLKNCIYTLVRIVLTKHS